MIFSTLDYLVFWKEAERLVKELHIQPGFRIAEIGAGKGLLSVYLAKYTNPGGEVYATEFEAKKVEKIRVKAQKEHLTNLHVLLAKDTTTNLPKLQFDLIVMAKVYHHFTHAGLLNQEFFELLKPGGHLAIVDFEPKWFLKLSTPKDIPKSYGGHGIYTNVLIEEVTSVGFKLLELKKNWSIDGLYWAIFQKP